MNFLYQRFILLSLLGVFFSCNTTEESSIESVGMVSCRPTETPIIGGDYLSRQFMSHVSRIETDKGKSESVEGMVFIEGGAFEMGGDIAQGFEDMRATALPQKDEFPKHQVQITDFYMDKHEVTVREFAAFVEATNYVTVAERDIDWEELKEQLPAGTPKPSEEDLKAGSLVFHYLDKSGSKDDLGGWWKFEKGISWRNPDGLNPTLEDIYDQPVTQVSWYDALAYAKWVGKRLPTEAEYEYAMRAGKQNTMYPWGDSKIDNSNPKGNFFQGDFPYYNEVEDGYEKVAPVMSFGANDYGLYDISGNVWEWTLDWYSAKYYLELSKKGLSRDPQGPEKTFEVYNAAAVNKVVRGGSFLCNDSWCSGYRNARRMRLSPDSGMEHVGFRLVREVVRAN